MAKRFTAITGGTALALALVFAALQGCGGGSDKTGSAGHNGGGGSTGGGGTTGGTIQQVCEQFCDKLGTCFAVDAGIPIDTVVAGCKSSCSSGAQTSGGAQCTNANAILSAWQACLQGTCDDLETCSYAIPACQGGGAGGIHRRRREPRRGWQQRRRRQQRRRLGLRRGERQRLRLQRRSVGRHLHRQLRVLLHDGHGGFPVLQLRGNRQRDRLRADGRGDRRNGRRPLPSVVRPRAATRRRPWCRCRGGS